MSELAHWLDPRRRPFELLEKFFEGDTSSVAIKVEEVRDGDSLIVRAELPGIDPDKDVDVSIVDGSLHISGFREEKTEQKDKDSYRSEFRYGSFSRTLPLPEGATAESVTATYKDGVLEVRVPVPTTPPTPPQSKINVTRG
ncbi:Hsp20/alpha crystallin family protein [Sinomonas sp. ASV486]|uniref:Hsp20/alpha crystallin family protein n=1 Tax=Sinomonas sp. ASV486 TaxID=3051170 RepID=UPI0027DCEC13|nr:Hsp20/alpha crystallin family protein [Sinomonas sp. ASV486]MDQ4489921.1 Hsp20/alpha crystallin family protein [Sinomonas sp. ASV486]